MPDSAYTGGAAAWGNLVDAATVSTTSAMVATLPISNLKDRRIAKIARTSDNLAKWTIDVDFGTAKSAAVVGIFGINSTKDVEDTVRRIEIKGSNISAGGSEIFSKDYSPGGSSVTSFPTGLLVVMTTNPTPARYWRLLFTWGKTDAFWQAGRLWISDGLRLPLGVNSSWSQILHDDSTVTRSRGQQVYADERPRYRILNFDLEVDELATGSIFNLASFPASPSWQLLGMQAGVFGEVVMVPRATDVLGNSYGHVMDRHTIHGHLAQPLRIDHISGKMFRIAGQVKEEL